MMSIATYDLYEFTLQKFGYENQKMKLIEELSELIRAVAKHNGSPETTENLIDELADAQIMIEQIIQAHRLERVIPSHKEKKLDMLRNRVYNRDQNLQTQADVTMGVK